MARNRRFYVDCDEVLRKLLDKMLEVYNRTWDKSVHKEKSDITDFVVEKSFPEMVAAGIPPATWFFETMAEEVFCDAEAFPHVAEDIKTLRCYGDVYILTYQKGVQNKIYTLEWLEKHDIEYDGIIFSKDKTIVNGEYFIDDNDWNFKGSKVDTGILVDAPYNKEIDIDNMDGCRCMIRVSSLHEFVENFQKLQKQVKKAE